MSKSEDGAIIAQVFQGLISLVAGIFIVKKGKKEVKNWNDNRKSKKTKEYY